MPSKLATYESSARTRRRSGRRNAEWPTDCSRESVAGLSRVKSSTGDGEQAVPETRKSVPGAAGKSGKAKEKKMAARATATMMARESEAVRQEPKLQAERERRDRVVIENLPLVRAIAVRGAREPARARGARRPRACRHSRPVRRRHQVQPDQDGRFLRLRQAPHQGCHSRQPAPAGLGLARPAPAPQAGRAGDARVDRFAAAHTDRRRDGPADGRRCRALAPDVDGPAQHRAGLGLHALQRPGRSARPRLPRQARIAARFDVRPRRAALTAGRSDGRAA